MTNATHSPAPAATLWQKICFGILKRIDRGTLNVRVMNDKDYIFTGTISEFPVATITVRDKSAWRDIILGGHRAFFHGYIEQKWESDNLLDLFGFYLENRLILEKIIRQKGWFPFCYKHEDYSLMLPDRHHNTFFAQWLDPTLTFSCAMFDNDDIGLEEAQERKFKSLCERMALEPHHKLLEIGPGFGGFALYAAKNYGARTTMLTDNVNQKIYLERLCETRGFSHLIDVQMRHPKDVRLKYDRVVMIEHIERIGDLTWPMFFSNIYDCLVPGGQIELQCLITSQTLYGHAGSFMCTDVKKGCDLPEITTLERHIADAGFLDLGHVSFGQDYSKTIAHWHKNFTVKWPQIAMIGYNDKYRRLWLLCMMYCAAGFKMNILDVIQKTIVKPENAL